jgi:uncharacterized membrane-anchored protein
MVGRHCIIFGVNIMAFKYFMSSLGVLCLASVPLFWIEAVSASDEASKVQIDWIDGPVTARLGDIAEIKVPAGYRFTGQEGTRKFLELTQNPPGGNELGTIVPETSSSRKEEFWFVMFEFSNVGYVKDDERDKLDANVLLKTISDNTEESNKERAKRG